jgi:putative colanic acid biosynthesis UDP-glucose lipid carrier transferase
MKRVFDLLVSGIVIVCILSWLLPILALLIIWDSRGPVFFVQKRVGRYSHLFSCYKLRTMVVNDQADHRPVMGNDARITRLGSWLRRSHLDELPQFFNVFLGSMSLVGPRPYMPSDCRLFEKIIPDTRFRNRVKPGITGMSQSKGLHGVIWNTQTIRERYYWDAYYVLRANFWLDLRILGQTIVNHMIVDANRSISSNWGLHWSKKKSTPTFANSPMRSSTMAGVPTSPERNPRLDTE